MDEAWGELMFQTEPGTMDGVLSPRYCLSPSEAPRTSKGLASPSGQYDRSSPRASPLTSLARVAAYPIFPPSPRRAPQ
eukprot:5732603-Pleurochrysis_carterae.AAC.1